MSHLYTSLASALKMNKQFLEKSSPSFRALCEQINKKQFNTCHSKLQKEVCYAMKQAAKMVNNHKVVYQINETMREELNLFAQALSALPNIEFSTPIAFIIPRTPSASIFGDSSLLACGGYSIALKFWWQKLVIHIHRRLRSTVQWTSKLRSNSALIAHTSKYPTETPNSLVTNTQS